MDELRTLPKEVAVLVFIKVLLVIIAAISVGLLLVGGVAAVLYHFNYPISTIVTFSVMAWVIFILILVVLMYRFQSRIKQSKDRLIHVVEMELLGTVALRGLNIALRKWRHKHEESQ